MWEKLVRTHYKALPLKLGSRIPVGERSHGRGSALTSVYKPRHQVTPSARHVALTLPYLAPLTGLLVWFIALAIPFFGVINDLLGAFAGEGLSCTWWGRAQTQR